MDIRQLKTLGGMLVVVGGVLLGISAFLNWWGVCFDVGSLGEVCGYARGFEDWPGRVALVFASALLVLGILGLTLGAQAMKAVGFAAICVAALGVLLAILSIAAQDSIVGTEGTTLTIGPFVAGIATGIALGGGIVLLKTPSAQTTPERPPPPPVPAGGFTA